MTRVFLTIGVPLLLPTALYLLWAASMSRAGMASTASEWRALPWAWLLIGGAVLAVIALISVVEIGGVKEGRYVAPHVENGTIVPGHVAPPAR